MARLLRAVFAVGLAIAVVPAGSGIARAQAAYAEARYAEVDCPDLPISGLDFTQCHASAWTLPGAGQWRGPKLVNRSFKAVAEGADSRLEVQFMVSAGYGTYRVPVTINGVIPLPFMVDSGASDVVLPADVVMTLMRTGTLRQADFLGQQNYRLADGTIMPSQTFRLKSLQVGNRMIENVTASTTGSQGALLLGQSFLSRFGKVSFDYGKQVLILE